MASIRLNNGLPRAFFDKLVKFDLMNYQFIFAKFYYTALKSSSFD
ncbi:hypothetical protein CSUNSWCD_871 [Campylobacter showae CSUNSWCD]|uniref:Uncharacterized protein n=1 Tax=Campylobacter showae CSUNSWCD TaxID=1244083 RepID=M5IIA5_9BACT|nr:hypothetical protein CSUNSWCD_871 [Campylobacter showae CSUNSWCD]